MAVVGRVLEIWRHPVSSLGGEKISRAKLTLQGLAGDREYGLIDSLNGIPAAPEKEARWRKALYLQASYRGEQIPSVQFPDGTAFRINEPKLTDVISEYFGFPVQFAAYEHSKQRLKLPLSHYRQPHFPVHLLTTASVKALAAIRHTANDSRRFRPTVLIETVSGSEGFVENEWVGRKIELGTVKLFSEESTKRCGMTFISQPGIEEDPEILRSILRFNKRNLGIYCSVSDPGLIGIGDEVCFDH